MHLLLLLVISIYGVLENVYQRRRLHEKLGDWQAGREQ
jgi:hypothetical protein